MSPFKRALSISLVRLVLLVIWLRIFFHFAQAWSLLPLTSRQWLGFELRVQPVVIAFGMQYRLLALVEMDWEHFEAELEPEDAQAVKLWAAWAWLVGAVLLAL
jgi:hypothetical protein